MSISIHNNLNLRGNQLLNARIHNASTAPIPKAGMLYYNTEDNKFYGSNGTSWFELSTVNEVTSSTLQLNFGSAPGSNTATLNIVGQTNIKSNSIPKVSIEYVASGSRSAEEILVLSSLIHIICSPVTEGVGFTIHAISSEIIEGTIPVKYSYNYVNEIVYNAALPPELYLIHIGNQDLGSTLNNDGSLWFNSGGGPGTFRAQIRNIEDRPIKAVSLEYLGVLNGTADMLAFAVNNGTWDTYTESTSIVDGGVFYSPKITYTPELNLSTNWTPNSVVTLSVVLGSGQWSSGKMFGNGMFPESDQVDNVGFYSGNNLTSVLSGGIGIGPLNSRIIGIIPETSEPLVWWGVFGDSTSAMIRPIAATDGTSKEGVWHFFNQSARNKGHNVRVTSYGQGAASWEDIKSKVRANLPFLPGRINIVGVMVWTWNTPWTSVPDATIAWNEWLVLKSEIESFGLIAVPYILHPYSSRNTAGQISAHGYLVNQVLTNGGLYFGDVIDDGSGSIISLYSEDNVHTNRDGGYIQGYDIELTIATKTKAIGYNNIISNKPLLDNYTYISPGGTASYAIDTSADSAWRIDVRPAGPNNSWSSVDIGFCNDQSTPYTVNRVYVGNTSASTLTENFATGFVTVINSPVTIYPGSPTHHRVTWVAVNVPANTTTKMQVVVELASGARQRYWSDSRLSLGWEELGGGRNSKMSVLPSSGTFSIAGLNETFGVMPSLVMKFNNLTTPVATLFYVGDSHVAGYGDNGGVNYRKGLGGRLNDRFVANNYPVAMIQLGNDGQTSTQIKNRFFNICNDFDVRCAMVQFGSINNFTYSIPASQWRADWLDVEYAMSGQALVPILGGVNNGATAPNKADQIGEWNWIEARNPLTINGVKTRCINPVTMEWIAPYGHTDNAHFSLLGYDALEEDTHAQIESWLSNYGIS